jgi:hypothetical protein
MKAFELLRSPFTAVLSISRVTFQTKAGAEWQKCYEVCLQFEVIDKRLAESASHRYNDDPYFLAI